MKWKTIMRETLFGAGIFPATQQPASQATSWKSPNELLKDFLTFNRNHNRLHRLPLAILSAICDFATGLVKNADDNGLRRDGERFLLEVGLPNHHRLLKATAAPTAFRNWLNMHRFTWYQRNWQRRFFEASKASSRAGCVATGTDELARCIADQIARDFPNMTAMGQVYTTPRRRSGRPPAIEASLRVDGMSTGLVALDGKDPATERDILKVARDCRSIAQLHPEYNWVQGVVVLPKGCDVRSDSVLEAAFCNRVIIATTDLPTRPLGLATSR